MEKLTATSSFHSLPIEVFWYPASSQTRHVVLLLKGIYGVHEPTGSNSWDNQLISTNADYNFICINTARVKSDTVTPDSKEAFFGKTFSEECDDIIRAVELLEQNGLLPDNYTLTAIGNSFGGTTLLGVPNLLTKAQAVVMIGSGCGKSPTTAKPLLSTMPDEEVLLAPLKTYSSIFVFIRGTEDDVVPKESQDKIIAAVKNAREHVICDIAGTSHNLKRDEEMAEEKRNMLFSKILRYCMNSK